MLSRLELKLSIFKQKKEDFQREVALHERGRLLEQEDARSSPRVGHSGRSGKSEASPAGPRTSRVEDELESGQIAMIRAPSLVEVLKNTEPPSARTELSEDESRSNKSNTLIARVVSSGNSSSAGSQSLNSARLLASVLSPRGEDE